jgi:hypothetical protein
MDSSKLDPNIYQAPDALLFLRRFYEAYYNAQGKLKPSALNGGDWYFKLWGRELDTLWAGGPIVPRANVDIMTVKENVFTLSKN